MHPHSLQHNSICTNVHSDDIYAKFDFEGQILVDQFKLPLQTYIYFILVLKQVLTTWIDHSRDNRWTNQYKSTFVQFLPKKTTIFPWQCSNQSRQLFQRVQYSVTPPHIPYNSIELFSNSLFSANIYLRVNRLIAISIHGN